MPSKKPGAGTDSTQSDAPLRGEAAYNAERRRIAERNDAAYARERAARTAREEVDSDRRRAAERAESANLPVQPTVD